MHPPGFVARRFLTPCMHAPRASPGRRLDAQRWRTYSRTGPSRLPVAPSAPTRRTRGAKVKAVSRSHGRAAARSPWTLLQPTTGTHARHHAEPAYNVDRAAGDRPRTPALQCGGVLPMIRWERVAGVSCGGWTPDACCASQSSRQCATMAAPVLAARFAAHTVPNARMRIRGTCAR